MRGGVFILVSLALALPCQAAFLEEYFDYGDTGGQLFGKAGGSNWTGAWFQNTVPTYIPTTNLTYNGAGYVNTGAGGAVSGNGTASMTNRATGALTGTIWISFLTQQSVGGEDMLFWLDKTDGEANGVTRDFIALRGSTLTTGGNTPEAVIAYNGAGDDGASTIDFAPGTTHLVLAKIDMNFSGALDQISMWVNPDLSGGEVGLGSPIYLKNTLDAYGTTFDGIGVSFNSNTSFIDAIRISNEANGFLQVTTAAIPEPGMICGCALVGLFLVGCRKSIRASR